MPGHLPRAALLLLASLLAACSPHRSPAPAPGSPVAQETVRGWYVETGDAATLQPCDADMALRVTDGSALRERAKAFGLQADLPVYVVVRGARTGDGFRVVGVDQFGSQEPVRDCPMHGTTLQH